MDKDPKLSAVPHTDQQSAERVADLREEKAADVEKVLKDERILYATLLKQKQELFGALESAKRNKDQVEEIKTRRELDDVEAAIKVYDKEFPEASVDLSILEDEAIDAKHERNRRLN